MATSDRYIHYRSGYKHQLVEDYHIVTTIKPAEDITTDFITLDTQGNLTVKKGYAWDGVSGPVRDTDKNLRASLVHDSLYQLMRLRKISRKKYKDKADRLFQKHCREDGTPASLASLYYQALKKLGNPSTKPESIKSIKSAPEIKPA